MRKINWLRIGANIAKGILFLLTLAILILSIGSILTNL